MAVTRKSNSKVEDSTKDDYDAVMKLYENFYEYLNKAYSHCSSTVNRGTWTVF